MHAESLVLTVAAVLVGLAAGLLRHGRVANLARLRVRAWPLLVLGVAGPPVVDGLAPTTAWPWIAASLAALVGFALANLRLVGMSVVAVGLACNLVPLVANRSMPVRADALVQAGLVDRADLDRVDLPPARALARPGDRLRFLGDVVPLSATSQVLSFGDLIVLVGLADVVSNALLRRRGRARAGVAGELPAGAEALLLAIAVPDDRVDSPSVIDLRRLEEAHAERATALDRASARASSAPADAAPPAPLDAAATAAVPAGGPPAATRRRRGRRAIPDFDAIVLDEARELRP